MSTFGGHTMIGTAFSVFGARWTYCTLKRYFLCHREQALAPGKARRFESSLTFPTSWCPGFPLEAALCLIAVSLITAGELIALPRFGIMKSAQHLTMFSFYFIAAFVVILKHYRYPMVPDIEYVCLILSFSLDTFLINRHLAMKSALEVQVHQDTMLVMMVASLVMCLEIKYRHNAMLTLIRAYCFSLHGSWLIMQDFMLYSPWGKWPEEDHKWIMIATISFGIHVIGQVLLVGLINCLTLRNVRSLSPAEVSLALDREGLGQRGAMYRKIGAPCSEEGNYLLINSDDDV